MRGFRSIARISAPALLVAALPVASVALDAAPAAAETAGCVQQTTSVVCTFVYNGTNGADGSTQQFTVPAGITSITVDAWGAQGGGDGTSAGGLGGHERSTITVTPGQVLDVVVGGRAIGAAGGFNGGGASGINAFDTAYGGGGASDVRPAGGAFADRIVTAGGGGGRGFHIVSGDTSATPIDGGKGGGTTGLVGTACVGTNGNTCGHGGTDSQGGAAGTSSQALCTTDVAATAGQLGAGGAGEACTVAASGSTGSGGGGGGWYGGGGGALALTLITVPTLLVDTFAGSGGGGSGHVASGTDQLDETGVRSGNGLVTITYTGTIPPPPPPPKVPSGPIFCPVAGTITFKKPLTNTPSTKTVTMKVAMTGSSCDHSNVVGGKAPITDVSVTETDSLSVGATCNSLTAGAKAGKIVVKWQARKPTTNKPFTVASNSAPDTNVHIFVNGGGVFFGETLPIAKPKTAAFMGETIVNTASINDDSLDIINACQSTGLSVLHVSGVIHVA
jgi:hypothetical protein